MKKLLTLIIITLSFFSIFNFANAKNSTKKTEWSLEKLLDLDYWPEEFELYLPKISNIYLRNARNRAIFRAFRDIDNTLRNEFMKKYRNGSIDYNATNGIIDNYSLFVYHTNKYFYYLSVKEANSKYSEVDEAIAENYRLSRAYIKQVKYILSLEL